MQFLETQHPDENILLKIDLNYFMGLFDTAVSLNKTEMLFDKLPTQHAIDVCQNLLKLLRNIEHLQFIVNYLLKVSKEDLVDLKNIKISLKILSCVSSYDQDQYWCLMHKPLSILEVYVMNTKLDKLGQILEVIKPELSSGEYNENDISIEKIDEILRHYAEKSLDFRIITQPNPRLLRTPESKLLQSIDTLNIGSERSVFEMPQKIPEKSEWVQNNEVQL